MFGNHLEAGLLQQLAKRGQRELVEVSRQVEVKPRRTGPSRLRALEVRNGDHDATTRSQDSVNFQERLRGVRHVLEDVPDDHFVEGGACVVRVSQPRSDSNFGPRIGAAHRLAADFDTVHLEAAVGERSEQDTAAASDVEHARPRRQASAKGSRCVAPRSGGPGFRPGAGTSSRARRSIRPDRGRALLPDPEWDESGRARSGCRPRRGCPGRRRGSAGSPAGCRRRGRETPAPWDGYVDRAPRREARRDL